MSEKYSAWLSEWSFNSTVKKNRRRTLDLISNSLVSRGIYKTSNDNRNSTIGEIWVSLKNGFND